MNSNTELIRAQDAVLALIADRLVELAATARAAGLDHVADQIEAVG